MKDNIYSEISSLICEIVPEDKQKSYIDRIMELFKKYKYGTGKHAGHRNDDKTWCYECGELGEEDEF